MTTDALPDGTRDTDALSQAQRLTKLQAVVDDRVRMTFGTVKAMQEHPTFFKPIPEEKRRGC